MLCALILYVSGGTLLFNVDSERQILRNFFTARLFTLRVFARNLLREIRQRNIFHISFLMTDLGYEPKLLRLISRHTTYWITAISVTAEEYYVKICDVLIQNFVFPLSTVLHSNTVAITLCVQNACFGDTSTSIRVAKVLRQLLQTHALVYRS